LAAFGQLLLTTAARAQTAPPVPAPVAAPPAAPPPDAPSPPPYDGYPPPQLARSMMPVAGPVVRLTTDTEAARLQLMRLRWMNVCSAPCDVAVDPNGIYRMGGGTVRPSEEFRMPRSQGTVLIDTQAGSTVKHWSASA
jgi:hypothetical protein